MILGALVAAAVGALLAMPALRLGGIYLALATLAFALMFDNVLAPSDWVERRAPPVRVPRPRSAPSTSATTSRSSCSRCSCSRSSACSSSSCAAARPGTYLDALRGSETAARVDRHQPGRGRRSSPSRSRPASPGSAAACSPSRTNRRTTPPTSSPSSGLVWVVLVVTIGARTVEGAISAGFAFAFVPEILKTLGVSPGVPVHPVRPGRDHLRQAPRGHRRVQQAHRSFCQRRADSSLQRHAGGDEPGDDRARVVGATVAGPAPRSGAQP